MTTETFNKPLAVLLPPPFEVKSHARDDSEAVHTAKLKNLASSVKVPHFHNLKSVAFWVIIHLIQRNAVFLL